jgi:hypothetical protein
MLTDIWKITLVKMLNTHKTGEFKEPETYTAEH